MTRETLDLHALLTGTFLKITEQLTFMFGEPAAKEELDLEGIDFLRSEMEFTGQVNGSLCVALPREATREIAANILGLEPDDSQSVAMTSDALGELLNVICGEVVRGIVGEDADFTLRPPRTEPLDASHLDRLMLDEGYVAFVLDDHPGFFGLELED